MANKSIEDPQVFMDVIASKLEEKMSNSLVSLKHHLSGLRTGRASVSLLEPVRIEAHGVMLPLNQVATVSAPEARMLVIQVWEKGLVKSVEKAVLDSGLGLNPVTEGQVVRIHIPNLSEERRRELVKKAHEYCEDAKVSIRNTRREANESIKELGKEKKLSEDILKVRNAEVQKATDLYIHKIDQLLVERTKELMIV